jgi:hypothetical protein
MVLVRMMPVSGSVSWKALAGADGIPSRIARPPMLLSTASDRVQIP